MTITRDVDVDERTGVLIVGGGIAGLSAALFLARYGVRATLVERHPATALLPQARAFNPRTMEIYRGVGLEDRIRTHTSMLADHPEMLGAATLCGPERFRVDLLAQVRPPAGVSPTDWCMVDQDQLERVVRAEAERTGADIRFDNELESFELQDDAVTATVRNADGVRRVRADWLIAADGHRAGVRHRLGIDVEGPGAVFDVAYFLFDADLRAHVGDRRFLLAYLDEPRPGTALVPVRPGRWSLGVPFAPGTGPTELDAGQCAEFARAAIGDPDLDIALVPPIPGWPQLIWTSTVGGWVARTFRSGRAFIIGDAAHVLPPAGSYGANTAIADAHNLAWKIAAVESGYATERLLDTYDAERRPVARRTLQAAMALMQDRHSANADVLDHVDEVSMMFGYSYAEGWDGEPADPRKPSGQPGLRAPHVRLLRDGCEESSLDLIGDGLTLFCGPDATAWLDAACRLADRYEMPLEKVAIGHGVTDPDGRFTSAFGITPDGASLVRPDGFITWRSTGRSPAADTELADAAAAAYGRTTGEGAAL
jgi:putative polyketide hydroxylase